MMIHALRNSLLTCLSAFGVLLCGAIPDCEAKPVVVTTTSIIADTARKIGGDAFEVTSIMGEGVDPHLYKASPGDMKKLLGADIILHNGLHLEGKMADALEKLTTRKVVVAVANVIPRELLRSPNGQPDAVDPHVWFAPLLWHYVADEIGRVFSVYLPAASTPIKVRVQEVKDELANLDAWVKEQLSLVPPEKRLLITAHDAFSYFSRAYDLEVLSIQGMSTDSEASLQEINGLVDIIVNRRVPAVFVESSVPQKTVRALVEGSRARNHEVVIGGELYSDALGASGSSVGTLSGIIRHNTNTIVAALKGLKQ